ncbi:MAG: glycosyltransferase [Acidaminococcaceae bacterium]
MQMMNNNIKKDNIAIIITKLTGGGAERAASNLSMELCKKYNVYVIVFDNKNQTYTHGGILVDLKLPLAGAKWGKTITILRRVFATRKIKNKYNITCSISLLEGPNLINVLSKTKDKTITSIRNMQSEKGMSSFRKKLLSYVSNNSDKVVAVSELVKLDMIDNFNVKKEKVVTIYNACDQERIIKSLATGPELQLKDKYVINIGRLTLQKGQWHLIRAFKRVKEILPELKLAILGEGELEEQLKILAEELQLENNVLFLGYVKDPYNIVSRSEALISSSIFEGLSNVLLETLALGKTIISTDCKAGPREILAPNSLIEQQTNVTQYAEYGILVPPVDKLNFNSLDELTQEEIAMAEAIVAVVTNQQLRERYEKMAMIRSKDFCPDAINKNWFALLENIQKDMITCQNKLST